MKVIDLLNKIANGEEVPKKIYCFNREFYLKGNTYFGDTFTLMHYIQEEDLNDEVEIIEEPQEHKIPEKLQGSCDMTTSEICRMNNIEVKINEILDYLEINNE